MTQAQVTIETGKDAMEVGNGAKLVLTNIRFDSFVEQWLYVWANYPGLAVLLCLMVIDVAMGSIAATVGGKLSSNVSYKGHMKKGAILLILGSAKLMELVLPGAPLLFIGTLGFIAFELKSIVENAGRAGVPLPPKLMRAFEVFRENEEREAKPPTVLQVNLDGKGEGGKPLKADAAVNLRDSGVIEVHDLKTNSTVVIPPKASEPPASQPSKRQ